MTIKLAFLSKWHELRGGWPHCGRAHAAIALDGPWSGMYFSTSYSNSPVLGSLLKEAEFHAEQREHELNRRRQLGLSSSHHSLDNADFDNKDDDKHDQRLLSQFGIWFLVRQRPRHSAAPSHSVLIADEGDSRQRGIHLLSGVVYSGG